MKWEELRFKIWWHYAARIVVFWTVIGVGTGASPLECGALEGESPVVSRLIRSVILIVRRVGLFGNAALTAR